MKNVPSFSGLAGGALFVRVGGDSALATIDAPLQGRCRKRAGRLHESPVFHHPDSKRRAAAFTLIELLVVISIIAVLAGLAFPAATGALNSARKAEARNDVQQIVAAVKAFQSEYGRMPTSDINNNSSDLPDHYYSSNRNIMRALLGQDTTLNPKGISFLEVKPAGKNRSGLNSGGEFVDPWGQSYIIKLDTNYNGRTEYYGDRFFSVIVFSSGPDKSPGNPNDGSAPGKDDIRSFK
jgi:prepilin-type N-terminal cleavage/methylation domain-containing protein